MTRILRSPFSLQGLHGVQARHFSVLQRPAPSYVGHIPLNVWEQSTLAVGSAFMSLLNPRRGGKCC